MPGRDYCGKIGSSNRTKVVDYNALIVRRAGCDCATASGFGQVMPWRDYCSNSGSSFAQERFDATAVLSAGQGGTQPYSVLLRVGWLWPGVVTACSSSRACGDEAVACCMAGDMHM
jgi:hypothetical protein